ncbi:MAG: amino-acid N-acetyltransferase [Pseudomonadota bacterium]
MTEQDLSRLFVAWVRQAAPYIHAFRGRTFVLAFGGETLQGDAAQALAFDCNLLASLGIRLVLVHGARPQIEVELKSRKLKPRYHKGLRITDADALECVKSAMGVLRLEMEALLSKGLPSTPMAGGGIRVASGNYITAKPIGVVDGIDYQYTGAVRKVAADSIRAALDDQDVVLISPLGVSPTGEIFNLAMEEVAEAVAIALRADKLIFLGPTPGILDENGEVIDPLTADEAEDILEKRSDLPDELRRTLPSAIRACRQGVGRAHFLGRDEDGALLLELFTHAGAGTVVTRDPLARLREASIEDVGGILALIGPLEADGTLVRRSRELLEMEIERFSVLEHDGVIVGCAALYPFSDEKAAELACLAVQPEYRRSGYGEQILQHCVARARRMGLKRLFVLTTRTAHWFIERGFKEVGVDDLPAKKRELYNLQRRSKVLSRAI